MVDPLIKRQILKQVIRIEIPKKKQHLLNCVKDKQNK